jgi:hypothetical protein
MDSRFVGVDLDFGRYHEAGELSREV